MTKINALPRPAGTTVLVLLALAALALPASSQAAPLPEGSDPVLTLLPAPAVVPTTTVGNQSPTVEFELRNDGAEEATVEKVLLEGEDAGEFSFGGSNCGTLQPGDHCSAWVGFRPNGVGDKRTALHVTFAGGRLEQSFEVSGSSVVPHFSFQPASHDFGLQPIHSETQRTTFTIENDGAAATQIGSLGFSGDSNGFWFGNSDCWGRWMEPGETCSLEVDFGPSDVGLYETQVQLSANGESFSAEVTGEGGRPIVEATPNPADFGAATVGSTGAVQTIAIGNSGNVPTGFFIGIIAGGDSGSFQLLSENCTFAPLMPGASCTAQVRFRPQSAGPKSAHLAFFGEGEGGTMVELRGEGVAPAVSLVPSSYDFGAQASGSKGASHAFAVRNEGSSALELGSVAIVGTDLDQFPLTGDDCTGATLAPGEECLVRVRFAPDGAGAKAAKLRVGSESGTFTAPLRGLGTDAGSPGQVQAQSGPAQTAAVGPPPPRRRGHRHGRFVRGADVLLSRAQRAARARGRADLGPR
jgi:hypothetical protein